MQGKLSPVLVTCREYGKIAPGECRLASLGSSGSPPPGHVNSLVPMFLRTTEDAIANLAFAAQHFSRLASSLTSLAQQAEMLSFDAGQGMSGQIRDLVMQANEFTTNACIVGDGMTGAMRVPDAVTMLMTTRLNPAGSDCGREVAQPLLKELDAILEGGDDVAMLGSALDKYWGRLKESGLLLSLVKEQDKDKGKISPHLTGILAAFREQLFMACATAPMQVMRRTSIEQYALPDCLEAIVRMHSLGPQRALEIAGEMGCACLFPDSLQPQQRQMAGGGMCSMMTIKTAIKEDSTSQSALQAHENIVAGRAAQLPKAPRKRALKSEEALELAELKAEITEKSRKRTKAGEQGVIFVRSSVHKRKPTSALSTSLHMFDAKTSLRLDKDNMATAMSSVHAQPILLVPEQDKPRATRLTKTSRKAAEPQSLLDMMGELKPPQDYYGIQTFPEYPAFTFAQDFGKQDYDYGQMNLAGMGSGGMSSGGMSSGMDFAAMDLAASAAASAAFAADRIFQPRRMSVSSLGIEFPTKDPYDELFGASD